MCVFPLNEKACGSEKAKKLAALKVKKPPPSELYPFQAAVIKT
jgi:hypothetical protein